MEGWELVAGCDTCPGAHLPGHTHLGLIQDPISRDFRQDSLWSLLSALGDPVPPQRVL